MYDIYSDFIYKNSKGVGKLYNCVFELFKF